MDTEKPPSEQAKPADPPVDPDHTSIDVDGTSPSAGEAPLSPWTDDPSSATEQHDDSTATDESTSSSSSSTADVPSAAAAASSPSPPSGVAHRWLQAQYHDAARRRIRTPKEIEEAGIPPPPSTPDASLLDRFRGSVVGMAIGDALGAHVEFRPRSYLVEHPVTDFSAGGTWGLQRGQFTDDTSMALCLAASLIEKGGMDLYDQLVRYKWWFRHGYMSSTGECFDIGAATSQALHEFERRQKEFGAKQPIEGDMDTACPSGFDVYCSAEGVAGNGALMRLGPVPLFFHLHPRQAIAYAGQSGQITHGDVKARDACRYYAALIVAAVRGCPKHKLLSRQFYAHNRAFFQPDGLVGEIEEIANGSFRKARGYEDGIRGKGYIVPALEAALWAFWSTTTFSDGALAAVNLGDDTDTTAAIYGQLAGAVYGYDQLDAGREGRASWKEDVYAKGFLRSISEWLLDRGTQWKATDERREQLLIEFEIDADEKEDGPAAQLAEHPSAPPPATDIGGTNVTASVPSPPPQGANAGEVSAKSPVQSREEPPVSPSAACEQATTGSENESTPSAPAAASPPTVADGRVRSAADPSSSSSGSAPEDVATSSKSVAASPPSEPVAASGTSPAAAPAQERPTAQ